MAQWLSSNQADTSKGLMCRTTKIGGYLKISNNKSLLLHRLPVVSRGISRDAVSGSQSRRDHLKTSIRYDRKEALPSKAQRALDDISKVATRRLDFTSAGIRSDVDSADAGCRPKIAPFRGGRSGGPNEGPHHTASRV